MNKVSLHTLGCKLNYAETSTIANRFTQEGFSVVEFGQASDVVVVNSCTVTNNADKECRQIVRRALRANPNAFVIVTGCYAQLKPEEIASIEGVDMVLGATEKFRIFELTERFSKLDTPRVAVGDIAADESFGPAYSSEGDFRTRAFLKVQDGCDYNCSFCTIPLARGGSRSQPIADAVRQAQELTASGYREIVLTGVNTGDFGKNRGESLLDLLVALHGVQGLERLKISSIEPNLLTDEIIELAADSAIMLPHFHVPLQSGSDEILAKMRRRYKRGLYAGRVEKILELMPQAAIGVDVIVGFPGETEAHFMETYEFLKELPVAYFHVFTYSERDNTPANEYGNVVPVAERRERTRMLRMLSEKKRAAFAVAYAGTVRPVLFESRGSGDMILGLTDNYIRVSLPYHQELENRVVPVRLGMFNGEVAAGDVADTALAERIAASTTTQLPVLA